MNAPWKSLVYKEWHEQKWKCLALTAIVLLVPTALILIIPHNTRDFVALIISTQMMYGVLAGMFVGMSVAAGENTRRTMRLLQALPVPTWQAALVKLSVALVVVIVPLLILNATVFAVIGMYLETIDVRQIQHDVMGLYDESLAVFIILQFLAAILGTSSLLLWVAAVGVNRSDDIRAGAIGFLVCAGLWMLFFMMMSRVEHIEALKLAAGILLPGMPGALAFLPFVYREGPFGLASNLAVLAQITVAVVSHGALLWWFLHRFGRVPVPPKHTAGWEFSLLRPRVQPGLPFKSPWRAIVWQQLRQTGPLALLAAAFVLLAAAVICFFGRESRYPPEFAEMLAGGSLMTGWFVTLVAGIGLFIDDLAPGVNTFWRSRPVKVTQWFFVKYFTALAVLLLAFGGLIMLAWGLNGWDLSDMDRNTTPLRIAGAILFVVWMFVLLYTLAAAAYVLARQPLYAAILALGAYFLGWMAMVWLDYPNPWIVVRIVFFGIWALSLPAALILAWQAVKRDWGWKARR